MNASRHEVVHQIVAGCDRMEYIGYHACLGVFFYLLEAKVGGVFVAHGASVK